MCGILLTVVTAVAGGIVLRKVDKEVERLVGARRWWKSAKNRYERPEARQIIRRRLVIGYAMLLAVSVGILTGLIIEVLRRV
jgi:hypothetical protein